ncbi:MULTISPECIES: leucyl aminopeptidase [unclassified Pseudoalteromonas]|uniref:leucyl aminopeptidase n=1 Tax=unclassified Pseudoalteromonas TaxID=194690 RepID=UPI001109D2EE|nr:MULTISPECIES: leucyl aminopeptidase [unclassified Pseudoalteromonas]TMN82865.1 leucyl aminopeptidase [Pseudoalteromonas sp. S410]TMN90320.1 leucyl aminopeptidase [Pseudoalteromonas sp. S408]TMO00883.1 leucyl aminopeptidase [Pseudoalteromonas sp. S407]TMO02000.1 leucyl aminopeptidase [Pseudoalteromonas sp. S409]TMO12324.1 leucyl aminopeptidase [Pseudoalteromonas sp. S186]
MKHIIKASLLTLALSASLNTQAAQFSFSSKVDSDAHTLIVFYSQDGKNNQFKNLDKQFNGQLQRIIDVENFEGKYAKTAQLIAPLNSNYKRILVVGTGKQDDLNKARIAKLGGNIHAQLVKYKADTANVLFDDVTGVDANHLLAANFAHGANLRDHRFEKYKQTPNTQTVTYTFDVDSTKKTTATYKQLESIQAGVFLARDLTSEVATEMTPVDFANAAKELESLGVTITILKPEQLKELGMGALEAVGRGSDQGARLVVAHYKGSNDDPIALVGKGITFDSGGYSIKTGASIARMKSDMAGAAAVLGTVKAMAMAKADKNVVAVMGMAANMVSQFAVAPGDVVRTAEGLSVEILNTDAEGRLVLSDAMWYARKHFNPSIMIDVATLTGSKIRAVGNEYAAVFSKDDTLVNQLTLAGKQVNENLWRLPLGYKDMLKSDIADITNVGSGGPGATTAATFLEHFAGETRWVHIDIAGNALVKKGKGELSPGGTGYGVRLLSEWLLAN